MCRKSEFIGIPSNRKFQRYCSYRRIVQGHLTNQLQVYDAIQMDFMMPNIEGPAAIEIIREMGYTSPVIGISGTSYLYDLKIHKYSF